MKSSTIISLLIGLITLVFAFQNNDNISINMFGWGFNGSLALIIIATLFIGFFSGLIMVLPGYFKTRWDLGKKTKEAEDLKRKISEEAPIKFDSEGLGKDGEIRL